ncbi:MAG: DNA-binding response regulator [Gammaproteobacteria bacterium]|nr:DNA-binding response regulator [Gammaproteobacteria bacterium]
MRLLLLEDELDLAEAIALGLQQFNCELVHQNNGLQALNTLLNYKFDAIILDLGLPGMNGIEVLDKIRQSKNLTPIIILTAKDSTEDCVQALNLGADDYMTKPFDLNELYARLRALTRRIQTKDEPFLRFNNIIINRDAHSVQINLEELFLPRREYDLLCKFMENPGRVLTRDVLMQSIYNWDDEVDSNTLEVHIHNLRKKIHPNLIRTIRGIGYILEKIKSYD